MAGKKAPVSPVHGEFVNPNAVDLGESWKSSGFITKKNRVHQSLSGSTPGERSGQPPPAPPVLDHYAWQHHCRGLFQMPIAA
jgi:hypothetical protein